MRKDRQDNRGRQGTTWSTWIQDPKDREQLVNQGTGEVAIIQMTTRSWK